MAWIITEDKTAQAGTKEGTNENAVGVSGPSNSKFNWDIARKNFPVHEFRMADDDGEIYYHGKATRVSFEPLDDFGEPNAGCTSIQFKQEDGTWQTL